MIHKGFKLFILVLFSFFLSSSCSSQTEPIEEPSPVESSTNDDDPSNIDSNSSDDTNDDAEADYRILFVGNSLTYYNDLPKLVREEAKKKNIKVAIKSISKPNYAIVDHWSEGVVQQLIKSKKYDYVIIQQGPSSQADGYAMLVNDAKVYANLCKANDAKLAYYMVWPARYNYHTFDGVIKNYKAGAKANNAILCPVGKVWKDYFDSTQDFSYYGSDNFHPSLKGSKVAAQVIVNSLFTKTLNN